MKLQDFLISAATLGFVNRTSSDNRYGYNGTLFIDVTTHSLVLSDVESLYTGIIFTGALTSNKVFVLNANSKVLKIKNATTGNFKLSVRKSSGSTNPINKNETIEVF